MTLEDTIVKFREDVEKELETGKLSFPSSFNIIERLTELLKSDNSSIKDFSDLVQAEPVILAKVLRLANTIGRSGSGRMTSSPFVAIQRIGLNALSCLVYLNAMEYTKNGIEDKELRWTMITVWKHSVDVGCWACCLSKDLAVEDPDATMLSGIMSNIGQFFLLYKLSKYPSIDMYSDTFNDIFAEYTKRVTKQLLDIFILPTEVVNAYIGDEINPKAWYPDSINHLVSLGRVITNIQNPLNVTTESVQKKLFFKNLDTTETRKFNRAVNHVKKDRDELYNILCVE